MTALKVLQENLDSIEKKNGHAKGNPYSFYEWFLHEKSQTIKSTMLPSIRKACGFTILNDLNGKEYVPEFYTNDVENINSQIKFRVIDVFIQKMKDLIECIDAIYHYIDISMPYLEREILNLLENSSISKLEVRGFQ